MTYLWSIQHEPYNPQRPHFPRTPNILESIITYRSPTHSQVERAKSHVCCTYWTCLSVLASCPGCNDSFLTLTWRFSRPAVECVQEKQSMAEIVIMLPKVLCLFFVAGLVASRVQRPSITTACFPFVT